ncbi:uncharacterized protein LOC112490962 [Ziziphus jujuba]|uniref:Uncharacterized protein LOC112490962 n=1 Tax=Ziziphus jujuba TaxID=326968 RepID=A0A6P6FZX6_ZIZJJ|nr:uncharacterized protein LOC112490962 [Ziziphus jujuba]
MWAGLLNVQRTPYFFFRQVLVGLEHAVHKQYQQYIKRPKVYLWPASTTTGTKAGRTVQIILNLAGFKNVKSKEFFAEIWTHFVGSKNRHNTVKFVFKALNEIETSKNVLLLRSIWFDGDVCD